MKKKLSGVMLTFSALLLSGPQVLAEGDDLLRARASLGFSSYGLSLSGADSTKPDATSQYLSLGAGFTYATGDLYFDAAYSQSLDATHDWPNFEGDFERSDWAVTGGYLLDNGWSAFGGYKSGKSEFFRDSDPSYKLTFEAYGPFIGASKALGLKSGSSISVSGAIAFMTGDLSTTNNINDSGNAIGFSASAAYNLPLGSDSGMRLRGFYQSYSFTDFSTQPDALETILGAEASYYLNF